MQEFSWRFEGQVDHQVISALRVMFRLDEESTTSAEDALISHGGAAARDLQVTDGTDEAADAYIPKYSSPSFIIVSQKSFCYVQPHVALCVTGGVSRRQECVPLLFLLVVQAMY
jgi:hypothetical protein